MNKDNNNNKKNAYFDIQAGSHNYKRQISQMNGLYRAEKTVTDRVTAFAPPWEVEANGNSSQVVRPSVRPLQRLGLVHPAASRRFCLTVASLVSKVRRAGDPAQFVAKHILEHVSV